MDTDVLIVGAGPTGLTLAGDLARAGVPHLVLERRSAEPNTTRAFAVHARTLEQLDARGVADELVATGRQVPGIRLFGVAEVLLTGVPSRFPFVLVTPQYETERVLAGRGVEVTPGAAVASVAQDADGVTATLEDGRTLRARYLVGCDGVRSAVRGSLGLPFPGKAVLRSIMLADVRLAQEPAETLTVNSSVGAMAFIAPFGDGWYRIFSWNSNERPTSEPVEFDEVRDTVRRACGTDYGMHDPRWMSRFHSDERQAPRYRVGRVFLAGDAAHCHSPAGGQGMNTGIQDAANLGWKLASAVRGHDGLLDTYEAERHPIGKAALRASGALVRSGIARSAPQRALRMAVTRLALSVPAVRRKGALMVSGVGISYGDGADRVPDSPLPDGRRVYQALRDGRFLLLGTPHLDIGAWSERVTLTGAAPAADRITLVRPDAYTAWSGAASDTEGLRAALAHWCGGPARASSAS
ncbi:FAD-dependent monooxygenase [Pseudosporangium ferrugineum]|uniref:2-polyprenyl-6-methoxyphenol hydroxylase-like FAD-dependent oxidoreductase n=1 Tax=Pseudosporangium ferrugineum TaxID=439699 RepID=A0A2T0SFK9_9ACTN|nr:FAD-dependent monooxygenase [Pseudosporangium ferrugineum]PRY32133.1 2-polyprenyl-6-methoxyphenol hydroxylase-like FAD-dependent oxidoreductase [Pseudosporangium ferrugineum]